MNENTPIHSITYGSIRVSVWRNVTAEGVTYFDLTPSRYYKAKTGWTSTTTFREQDLPVLAKAVLDAHSWIQTQKTQQANNIEPDISE